MNLKPLLLVATGPTSGQFNFEPFRKVADVMVVSDAYKLCNWAKWHYSTDCDWWRYHESGVREHKAVKFTLALPDTDVPAMCQGLEWRGRRGFSMAYGYVFSGHNSSYVALQLATSLGYEDIFLVGLDMGTTGNTHFFGDHPIQLRGHSNFATFAEDFSMVPELAKNRFKVRLASSPSLLSKYFETWSHSDVLRYCKEIVSGR